jgi:thioredoxin-like negative regulator of GroEL
MGTLGRRWGAVLLLAAVAVGSLWAGRRWWEFRRHRRAMVTIEAAIEGGRHEAAARGLIALLAREPDSDEALYLLGTCEVARGRLEAADRAWARVPPGSPFATDAILGRTRIRADRGRFTEMEQMIRDAMADPRVEGSTLSLSLGPIWCLQGRLEETLRLIEARWNVLNRAGEGDSEAAVNLIRGHFELRRSPIPVEMVRASLDQAAEWNPEDDRVWLGKANLSVRVGAYDEAKRWLDACLRRRPEDAAVWRGRLDWAVATGRVAEVREALKHLPVGVSRPAEIPRIAAWLAGRRGDPAGERRALERVIADDPSDFAALDRLAELAVREGQPARAAELRGRKAEIDRIRARYAKLFDRRQPARDCVEMAHLAERLGLAFPARAFLTIATAFHPERDELRGELARLERDEEMPPGEGRTLADVLAVEIGATAAIP